MTSELTSWRLFLHRFARLGLFGFGGPAAHIVILREQWVDTGTISANEFNDAFASVSLLPGPASTQLAMWIGWRTKRWPGFLAASLLFVVPAVTMVLVLSVLVLRHHPPTALFAAALGAGAIVPSIALRACVDIVRGYQFSTWPRWRLVRVALYAVGGCATCLFDAAALAGALVICGLMEISFARATIGPRVGAIVGFGANKGALAYMALKIGALSFGGGFVIVPLMRGDAVSAHHWMTAGAFVAAVAIGQLTPGPVVATVAAVGYAAAGVGGGILAASIAFAPSMIFVGVGSRHLTLLRERPSARAFLDGAGPAAVGAIAGSSLLLARACALSWQWPLVACSVVIVVVLRRSTTWALVGGAALGAVLEGVWHVAL